MRRLVGPIVVLAAAGCRDATERRVAEIAALRDDAARGIEAVETFCDERDTAIAAAERGEPGAERVLAEVLLAPVVLDDYCEEFRTHDHDEHATDPAGMEPDTVAPRSDPAPSDTAGGGGP